MIDVKSNRSPRVLPIVFRFCKVIVPFKYPVGTRCGTCREIQDLKHKLTANNSRRPQPPPRQTK